MATARGRCECGGVRFSIEGAMRGVLMCHCRQCRRIHGHAAAYTAVAEPGLRLEAQETLGWYDSSPHCRRGFCRRCGASLFWQRRGSGRISVAAGSLEAPTGLAVIGHVFTADRGDYYALTDDLPQFEGSSGGTLGDEIDPAG